MQVRQVNMQAIATPGASVRPSGSQVVADSSRARAASQPRVSERQPPEAEVRKAVNQANADMAGLNENIRFGFSDEAGMLFVQVVDQRSGEVIRQIPSKEFLAAQAAARAAAQKATGLLLNRQG